MYSKKVNFVGITNKNLHRGCTNQINILLDNISNKKIVDVDDKNFSKNIKNNSILLFIAEINLNILKKISEKIRKIIIFSDRFYDMDLSFIKDISLIMPKDVIDEYKIKNPDVAIKSYPADLVTSLTKTEMLKRAKNFKMLNPVFEIVSNILQNKGKAFFVGGRVSLPDGNFKENTEKIFANAGADFVKDGKNGVVVFHGIRSFTSGVGG